MALIDILKLNEELDKMIATQEAEIKQIDKQIEADFASQWEEMFRELWALDDCARQLGVEIGDIYAGTMPAEKSGRCWWDTLYYVFGNKSHNVPLVYGKNYQGNICTTYSVYSDDGMNRRTTTMLKYWKTAKDKIHADFEAACVKAIKEKAEKANAKYRAALERRMTEELEDEA